ncbi:unnamed protein product, partial [Pylaiella littoralis]
FRKSAHLTSSTDGASTELEEIQRSNRQEGRAADCRAALAARGDGDTHAEVSALLLPACRPRIDRSLFVSSEYQQREAFFISMRFLGTFCFGKQQVHSSSSWLRIRWVGTITIKE